MQSPSLKVSVIVPSYNGAHKLPNILQALESQTFQDFETIVVVDGSTDHTRQVLAGTKWKLKNLEVVDRDNGGRSVARNAGIQASTGDLLIFFDDDVRPVTSCIESHLAHHHTYPETILVGAPFEEFSQMKTDFQKFKAHLSRLWAPIKGYGLLPPKQPFITAANFSVRKKLLESVGNFDERLHDAEDFDLAVRVVQQQIPIYFNNETIAWHDDFVTCRSLIKRHRQYHESHLQLQQIKPEIFNTHAPYQKPPPGFIKQLVYIFFSQKFWIWSIDKYNWLRILPKKVRYKIYNIVVTGYSVYFTKKPV